MTDGTRRMPVLFVSHGNPMNALEDNAWSRGFRALGAAVPRPKAVLSVSAHWLTDGVATTAAAKPETIHDFSGFPPALEKVRYPAPGDPALARRALALAGGAASGLTAEWGLDHGTWSVLVHMFPNADVPVVQLGMDVHRGPREHLALGRALAPLREEGVLVFGTGNVTHNLRHAFTAWRMRDATTPPWARTFDADAARALEQHDERWLVGAGATDLGLQNHPTPEHWWPLLYTVGASERSDAVKFPIEGFDMASLSMRAVLFG